jgi:twitching motility protein PilJ
MTTTPSSTSQELTKERDRNGSLDRLRNLLTSRVVETVSIALAISLALFGISSRNIWNIYRGFQDSVNKQIRLKELSKDITYYNEALTMSAYLAASTGELEWVTRYRSFEPQIVDALNEMIEISPRVESDLAPTQSATDKLFELESRALELIQQGKRAEAAGILFGKEYADQKQILAKGVDQTLANLKTNTDRELDSYNKQLLLSTIFAAVSLPVLILAWWFIVSTIRTYIQERNKAQQGLIASQASLKELNEELEARVETRTQQLAAQEQATREESEVLQTDVGTLLEIVSEVEEGDLTVQAPVSDRVTGLVADTFNRLIEQLVQVLGQVFNTAQQVTQTSQQLDESSKTVALNAQQQTDEVTKVLSLIKQVQSSASNSTNRINLANYSLDRANNAVEQGKIGIESLTQGIQTLQTGAVQIVRRTKDLDEFVDLTDQFVQEQSQIADLIQSLAMGATLLSARATAQQDPRQMMVLAKEFETVANQIKRLAEQTNQNLRLLQKRTDTIEKTVFSINQDLQGIDRLVSGFTEEVEKSTQVFGSIQSATENAIATAKTVANSSQQIVQTAETTAKAMGDIARIADQTAKLTQTAQTQSEQMQQIAQQLLQRIEFFRLPGEATKQTDLSQTSKSTVDLSSATST